MTDHPLAATLRAILPPDAIRAPEPRYLQEPRGRYAGQGGLVVAPENTDQVAATLRAAHDACVPVVPYGGGTGLVGGQIAPDLPAPIILTLERMARIRAVHADENVLVAEAGAILAHVQDAAQAVDRLFPLSLASEGSARIGGLLATNAGGLNVLRYGNARALCLGIEAVLADGTVWNGLTRLRKDNAGYDLRDLLIGSEGTLGIITAAALVLTPRPRRRGVALMTVTDPCAALKLLALCREHVGDTLSAFELIGRQSFAFLSETFDDFRPPLSPVPDWCVLIELGGGAAFDPFSALEGVFKAAMAAGLSADGLIAQSELQADRLWAMRESIPEANRRIGSISSHDISLPLSEIPVFIEMAPSRLSPLGDYRINCFGHLGDGNLHYNVFPQPGRSRGDHENERPAIKQAVHDLVAEMGGSVAAEHGVGRLKVEDLERYGDPALLAMMRAVKTALDPAGILNPGVMLRP